MRGGRVRLAIALVAAGVALTWVGAGDTTRGSASPIQATPAAIAAGDGGSATYSGTGPSYDFDLANSGTTTWRYIYVVAPTGSSFTAGKITSGGTAPCAPGLPDGQSNEIECGPFSAGGLPNTQVMFTGTLSTPVTCGAPFQLYVNSTGVPPYTRVGDATFSGNCGVTPKSCDAERNAVAASRARVAALEEALQAIGGRLAAAHAAESKADRESEKLRSVDAQAGGFLDLVGALDETERALLAAEDATATLANESRRLAGALKTARHELALDVIDLAGCGAGSASQLTFDRAPAATAVCSAEQAAVAGARARATVLIDATKRFSRTKLGPAELRVHAAVATLGKVAVDPRARRIATRLRATQAQLGKVDAVLLDVLHRNVAVARSAKAATAKLTTAKAALAKCKSG